MPSTAFVFPGQGSQYVGMGKDIYDAEPVAKEMVDHADSLLGFPLSKICFEGPEEELRQTRNTQPAIFLISVIVARVLKRLKPDMVAGHSLGEYSALVAAGALSFDDALRLVRLRGDLMQQAGERQQGTMAAVVGLSPRMVEEVCHEASRAGVVQAANFNAPGQIVISGSEAGVQEAMDIAKQKGAKLVKPLVVSGAFHSPLMESASADLKYALEHVALRDAGIPVYSNVTAEPVTRGKDICDLLHRQLTSPVRWEETIRNMARDGAAFFYEIGPGKVLRGLIKRTEPAAKTGGFDTYSDITSLHHA